MKNQKPGVILSFDDGPTRYFLQILSILQNLEVQGLFFWQSRLLHHKRPLTAFREKGHLIGNHGHTHKKLPHLTYEEQYHEIQYSTKRLAEMTGETIKWFRPAFGLYNEDTVKIVKELGLQLVLWNVASWDWKHAKDSRQILVNVLEHVSAGDIILLHEVPQTLEILPQLIQGIREKGLSLAFPYTEPLL